MNYRGSALKLFSTKTLGLTKLFVFFLLFISTVATSNLAFADSPYHLFLKPLPILVSQHQIQKLSSQQKETLKKVLVAQSWAARNSGAAGVVGEVASNVLSAIRGDAQLICSGNRGVDSVSRERLLTASECSAAKTLLASGLLRADLLGLTFFPRSCTELNSKYPNSGTSMTIIYKDGASDSGEPQDCSSVQSLIVSEFRFMLRREPSDQEIQSLLTSLGATSESRPTPELIRTVLARSVEFDGVVRSMYQSFGLNEPSQTDIETARSEAYNEGTEAYGYRLNRSFGSRFTRGYNLLVSWLKGTLNRAPDDLELNNVSRYVSANLDQSQSEIVSPEALNADQSKALVTIITDRDEQMRLKIAGFFKQVFSRDPTNAELTSWFTRMKNKTLTMDQVRVAIYTSPEALSGIRGSNNLMISDAAARLVLGHVQTYADELESEDDIILSIINQILLSDETGKK